MTRGSDTAEPRNIDQKTLASPTPIKESFIDTVYRPRLAMEESVPKDPKWQIRRQISTLRDILIAQAGTDRDQDLAEYLQLLIRTHISLCR